MRLLGGRGRVRAAPSGQFRNLPVACASAPEKPHGFCGESSGRLPWVEVGQQFLASIEAEPEQLVGRGVFFP